MSDEKPSDSSDQQKPKDDRAKTTGIPDYYDLMLDNADEQIWQEALKLLRKLGGDST